MKKNEKNTKGYIIEIDDVMHSELYATKIDAMNAITKIFDNDNKKQIGNVYRYKFVDAGITIKNTNYEKPQKTEN